ncbi:MAG: hypothetical protein BWK79_19210 [Beggiatoa sp. IS2]|nr:MAG: hypothetical protein BWK79_19210 [Beggiatoa sp. IS2]
MDKKPLYILGETDEPLVCVGEEENQQVTLSMIQQTDRHLDILSRHFDPAVYDTADCYTAFEELALRSRHTRIRILLHEPRQVAQRGHRIFSLGKRLSSSFFFRKPAPRHAYLEETFLIADDVGTIHRPFQESLKTLANFNHVETAKRLSRLFNEIWEEAEVDPDMYQLVL